MKSVFVFLIFLCVSGEMFAQSDSLTWRDDRRNVYNIRKTLLPGYEKLLNFIADPSNFENEIPEIIKTAVNGSREQRLFADEDVIIENDLIPGGNFKKELRGDQKVGAYLKNFNTSYKKSEDKTVFLRYANISPLKYKTYFYYTLYFECDYKSTNTIGQAFNPFLRVAEIKMVNDSGWHMYINGISFAADTLLDTVNTFHGLIPSDTNLVNLYNAFDNEEQLRVRELKRKTQMLMEEGRDNYTAGNLSDALKKFHEARMFNPEASEPKEWSIRVRKELEKKKADAELKDRRDQRIEFLRRESVLQNGKLNFPLAKILSDSLIYEYGINDPRITKMSGDLSVVNAAVEGINNARLKGKTEEAIKLCQLKQVEVTDSFYCAHFHYLEAELLSADEKPPVKQIAEKLNKSIELSGKRHLIALKMRAYLRIEKQKNPAGAIEDATLVVNNDPRNPEAYDFRASIYEKDNNTRAAIGDYANAIANKSTDASVFLKKCQLEYREGYFNDAIKSATAGMEFARCNGQLYFYRGLAELNSGQLVSAGKDFWTADKQCGISDKEKNLLRHLSDSCINLANTMAQQNQWASAVLEFSRSLTIDTSDYALYKRAECYLAMNRSDSAISDLDKLAARNQLYRNVYSKRGLAYSRLGKFEKANKDFETAVRQFPDDTSAFYCKGQSEVNQKNYKAAIISLEQSVKLSPSDSAYYLLSLASYNDRNYDQAIRYSLKARNKHTTKFEVFYICGRAYYEKGDYKAALEEFAIAKANVSFDPGLWFAHAATLEAMQKYPEASGEYDQLLSTVNYRDTANFRASVCKIKTAAIENYPRAVVQLDQYIRSVSLAADKSAPYAWKAYAYLCIDSVSQSADAITEAKKYNEKNPVLQLVLACRSTKAQDYESACIFLERALASREFKKEEIEQIEMLELLKKKNKKYKMLMQQYFP